MSIEKTVALNEVYVLVGERIHLPKESFDSVEAFYIVLNAIKEQKKICIEMLAFLHAEQLDAKTIYTFLDAHDIVKIGSKLIYDGDDQFGTRRHAMMALAELVSEVYRNLSKERMLELLQLQFSRKAIKAIEEARL